MRNMQDWAKGLMNSKKRSVLPIMTHPGIEMIGRTVYDAVTDGRVHFEAIKAVNEAYPQSAAATVIMDLTVEAEAFGCEISFPKNEVPSVVGRLVTDYDSVAKLEVPNLTKGRVPQYLLANKLAAENITDKPTLAGCIGPFSLAGRLFDMTEIMVACYVEPQTIELLLQKCTEFIKKYCLEFKKVGANGVVIAEPAAGLLSNDDCLKFATPYLKEIVEAVQDESFLVVLHNCGNTGHCTQSMVATGAWAQHFGNKIDMVKALEDTPSDLLVMGNLDPVALFKMASPAEMKAATAELLERTKDYPNFVLSSGCDTPPEVPAANIAAFYEALDEFNAKRA